VPPRKPRGGAQPAKGPGSCVARGRIAHRESQLNPGHTPLAFTTEHVIATTGGLARCDINAPHHGLHRTINSITGYIPPIDLVTASHQGQR
jgi:hypothetical protein